MARKSFVVRKFSDSSQAVGSWLRYEPGSGVDDDTKLRADDLIVAPVLSDIFNEGYPSSSVGFFEAYVDTYETVNLIWDAPLVAEIPNTGVPVPTSLVLTYSTLGEPATVNDGLFLIETSTATEYTHVAPEGKWAYYTIFVKYQDNVGNVFYEPGADLAVLVPKNYKSSEDMFAKVPLYYRLKDGELDSAGLGGPLERYLSTFGFEVDRMRTTVDFLMTCKDPEVSNSYVLDVLSKDLSIGLLSEELGPYRLRNILNSIGKLRRGTGTSQSIKDFYTALTGSNVTVDTTSRTILIDAQRANLIKDPNITYGLSGGLDAGAPNTSAFPITYDAGSPGTADSATAFTQSANDLLLGATGTVGSISGSGTASVPWVATVTGLSSASAATVGDGLVATAGTGSLFGANPSVVEVTGVGASSITYKVIGGTTPTAGSITNLRRVFSTTYDGGTAGGTELIDINANPPLWVSFPDTVDPTINVLQTANADVRAVFGDTLYFSVQNENVASVQNLITKVALYRVAGYGSAGAVEVASATTARVSGGTRYWELVIPSSITSYTSMFLCIFVPSTTPILESFKRMLLERSINAEYFDGDTVFGGWLRDSSGGSRSDYRWYNPANKNSIGEQSLLQHKNFSVYNSNYQKTRVIANRFLTSILPVTELSSTDTIYSNRPITNPRWTITFNNIPGVS